MTAASYQVANLLAGLGAGRRPEWVAQSAVGAADNTAFLGAPDSASDGVALVSAGSVGSPGVILALLRVGLRGEVHRRKADVTVDTRDASANYTVSVNGTAMATTTGSFATDDAILVELKAKIDADATVGGGAGANQVVDAVLLDSAGAVTVGTAGGGSAAVTLQVRGTVEADFYIDISATGSGVLACLADGSTATLRVFGTSIVSDVAAGSTAPDGWDLLPGSTYALTYRGFLERFNVAGLSRVYLELASLDGHASDGGSVTYRAGGGVFVGPCIQEG